MDFNPVADALRIVSDTEQNLRVPFEGDNAGKAREDEALKYGDGQNPARAVAAAPATRTASPAPPRRRSTTSTRA